MVGGFANTNKWHIFVNSVMDSLDTILCPKMRYDVLTEFMPYVKKAEEGRHHEIMNGIEKE